MDGEKTCAGCGRRIEGFAKGVRGSVYVGSCCPQLRLSTPFACPICKEPPGLPCIDSNTRRTLMLPHRSRSGTAAK